MSEPPRSPKITPTHLSKQAVVYLRQSSEHQVRHNLESQRLQYSLADRARALGWRAVDIVDTDLGASASLGAARREGFDHVLAAVARGEVGIVLAREVSRLSRTDSDFCRLIELCQVFGTLLGDDEQVYDPALMDDQLILGIKGTLSVVELRVLRTRLIQGMRNKAARGELIRLLPPGYELDGERRPVLDPDARVRDAIARVFSVFRQTWSARRTMLWFHSEGMLLPVRRRAGRRHEIVWKLPAADFIRQMLMNPWYAGAYTYGRRATEVTYIGGRLTRRQGRTRSPEECAVLLRDHHPGYITWEQFEEHRRIMRAGKSVVQGGGSSPVRNGGALLGGLLRCGRCGRRLQVRYAGAVGTAARYQCAGTFQTGGQYCLGLGGRLVDRVLTEEILRRISPLGMEASLLALERSGEEGDARRRSLQLRLEQVEYEARRAFEQYDAVDARNRLVAGDLERRWNGKLEEAAGVRASLDALPSPETELSAERREDLVWLGQHFETAWADPACPATLKKQIVRTLIEEIVVNVDEGAQEVRFVVHWKGGSHTALGTPKPPPGKGQSNNQADIDIIRQLAVRYDDGVIAGVLDRQGRQTGKGLRWNAPRVKSARSRADIAGHVQRIENPDVLTLQGAAGHCGVSDTTIRRLVEAGLVANQQTVPYAPWEIRPADLDAENVQTVLRHLKATGRLVLAPPRSAEQGKLFESFQGGSNGG